MSKYSYNAVRGEENMTNNMLKKIFCILMTVILLIPFVPVHAEGEETWTLVINEYSGETITEKTYGDKVQLLIFLDPALDENNDPANANTSRILDRLNTARWLNADGLQILLVAAADEEHKKDEEEFWLGRPGAGYVICAQNGKELLDRLNTKNEDTCFCAIYKDGKFVEKWGNCANDEECYTRVSKYLPGGQVTFFDVKIPVTHMQSEARKMLDLLNDFRTGPDAWMWKADNKTKEYYPDLKKMVWDYDLEKVAMQRAVEIALYFDHVKPDGTGNSRNGIEIGYYDNMGENLAMAFDPTCKTFMTLLREDTRDSSGQGHRGTMLTDGYTGFAAAIVEYNNCYYCAQEFSKTPVSTVKTPAADYKTTGVVRAWSKTVSWTAAVTPFTVTAGQKGNMSDHVKLTAHYQIPSYALPSESETLNTLQWSSDHPEIVSASGNTFTALSGGTAILSARTPDLKKTITCKVTVLDDPKESKTENTMYRLYNPNTGEHFYTAKAKERNALVSYGWQYEGVGWIAPKTSNTPVYRLYNSNAGDHHYTMNKKERDALIKAGWKDEGTGWYSDDKKTVPLYREYNPNMQKCNHNYTTNKKEHDYLTTHGWNNEGIGWYGINK